MNCMHQYMVRGRFLGETGSGEEYITRWTKTQRVRGMRWFVEWDGRSGLAGDCVMYTVYYYFTYYIYKYIYICIFIYI